jgi:predicted nucleic acid-binding protein
MIVADSGPIIALARINRLDLLRQDVGTVAIPDAVFEELVSKGRGRPGAAEVEDGVWIRRRAVRDSTAVVTLPQVLHLGEREAIVLAGEFQTRVHLCDSCETSASVPHNSDQRTESSLCLPHQRAFYERPNPYDPQSLNGG